MVTFKGVYMLKNILVVILFIFSSYCLADPEAVKPIIKEYPAPSDISLYPLENKITSDLIIYTPVPNAITTTVVHYLYDSPSQSLIAFSSSGDKDFRRMLDSAFGLRKFNKTEKDTINFINLLKNEKAELAEIKLASKNYKAFIIITKSTNNLFKYEVYILPQTQVNNIVRMITLDRSNQQEAEKIIGTLKVKETR